MEDRRHTTIDDTIESVSDTMDRIVSRFSAEDRQKIREMSMESELKMLKTFPYIVLCCVVIWLAVLIINGDYSVGYMVMDLCLVFVMAFMVIGVALVWFNNPGPFPLLMIAGIAMALSLMQCFVGHVIGIEIYTETFLKVAGALGLNFEGIVADVFTVVAVFMLTFFTTYGVLFITVSYLRKYLATVFLNMQKNAMKGVRGKSERFFQVPDIIDVKDVRLEPDVNIHKFDFRTMVDMVWNMLVFGTILSSYLFINPLFLETIDVKLMVSIMLLLSSFIPVLIIIVMSVRQVGANVVSDAPRPYYLWKGAKAKVMSSFVALGAFAVMLWLSLYYGHSLLEIMSMYITFLVPLLLLSIMYALMYVNNFSDPLKVSVLRRFLEGKDRLDRQRVSLLGGFLLPLLDLYDFGDDQRKDEHADRDDGIRDVPEQPVCEDESDDTENAAETEDHRPAEQDHESYQDQPHGQVDQYLG